jgi:hypothetical protein
VVEWLAKLPVLENSEKMICTMLHSMLNRAYEWFANLFAPADINDSHVYDNTLPQVLSAADHDHIQPSKYQIISGTTLGIGSVVEVNPGEKKIEESRGKQISKKHGFSAASELHLYGVIRWIGDFKISSTRSHLMVGVELEEDFDNDDALKTTDGTHNGQR